MVTTRKSEGAKGRLTVDKFRVLRHASTMTDLLSDITPEQYEEIAERYDREIGFPTFDKEHRPIYSSSYISFYAAVSKDLLGALQKRFGTVDCKLVKITHPLGKEGVYYKVIHKKEAFGLNIISKVINYTQIMNDIRLLSSHFGESFPDVKMLNLEYRSARIEEIANTAFNSFLSMNKIIKVKKV